MFGEREQADFVIVGSGFGGAMAAHELVAQGCRVVMLERGEWMPRGPENWDTTGVRELLPAFSNETPYRLRGERRGSFGSFHLVGGPSVLYGAVSLRFRERDFEHFPEVHGTVGADWPLGYADLEPTYAAAERLLGVAGPSPDQENDPTAPRRSGGWPADLPELSPVSERIARSTASLGLAPMRLPLAIHYGDDDGTGSSRTAAHGALPHRTGCVECSTCDGFACAVSAKNDLATVMLPGLIRRGLELRTGTVATRLVRRGRRILGVEYVDLDTGERGVLRAGAVVLAAGALASPHLVLASGLQHLNPAGDHVGRYLMRHANGMVFGVFPDLSQDASFHKQVGTHDLYFGHPTLGPPHGKLGGIQQVHAPPIALLQSRVPRLIHPALRGLVRRTTGLLTIAEDQPRPENRLTVSRRRNAFGMPEAVVSHTYTSRDRRARRALMRVASEILREAGARVRIGFHVPTFSHAVGTIRFGDDPHNAPLDRDGRFRGVENLWVTDGSFMPTSAAVNPSLTIAAYALRSARLMANANPRGRRLEMVTS